MLTPLVVALTLSAAPLTFEEGEVLGFTQDGDSFAWIDGGKVRRATVRNLITATEETFEVDDSKWVAWKKAHPLVKPTSFEGVKFVMKADGVPATTWGGANKVVKVELSVERGGLVHGGKSIIAEYRGAKVPRTTASAIIDPTGRRAFFVLAMESNEGGPPSAELVQVFAAPTVHLLTAPGADRDASVERLERAGFPVSGFADAPAAQGTTVVGDATSFAAAEQVAKVLSGKALKGKVNRALADLVVAVDAKPPR